MKTRIEKLTAVVEEAIMLAVEVKDLEEYKEALTIIFNNVRDKRELYRVTNDYNTRIYVDVEPESADYAKDWLNQWGEVKVIGKTLVYNLCEPDFDYDEYEDVFFIKED